MIIGDFFRCHIVGGHLISNFFIFTYNIPVDIGFNGIGNHIGTWIKSNDGVLSNIKLNTEKNSLEFIINYGSHLRKCFTLELKRETCAINFMSHPLSILFQPLSVHFILLVTSACDEVAEEWNYTWAKAGFRKKVHLEFFYNNDLVCNNSLSECLSIMQFGFWFDQLHA